MTATARPAPITNLGMVAQEQRQWGQAEQYYQQALAIIVEFNDRYSQARIYHNLGWWRRSSGSGGRRSSTTSRPWPSRSSSMTATARPAPITNLGTVAQEQRQWGQARDYFLKALAITAEFDDEHRLAITLRSLGRLWQASRDTDLPHAIASILQTTPEDVETRLSSLLSEET